MPASAGRSSGAPCWRQVPCWRMPGQCPVSPSAAALVVAAGGHRELSLHCCVVLSDHALAGAMLAPLLTGTAGRGSSTWGKPLGGKLLGTPAGAAVAHSDAAYTPRCSTDAPQMARK